LEASEKLKSKRTGRDQATDLVLTSSLVGSDLDSLTTSLESLTLCPSPSTLSTTFAGACERVSHGLLSRPTLNQLERMEIGEQTTTVSSVQQEVLLPEEDTEHGSFDDSNVFGIVGRTPTSEQLQMVLHPQTLSSFA
jgi:hypothetical protein